MTNGVLQLRKAFGGPRPYVNATYKTQEQRMDFSRRLFCQVPMSNVVEYATDAEFPIVAEEALGTTQRPRRPCPS